MRRAIENEESEEENSDENDVEVRLDIDFKDGALMAFEKAQIVDRADFWDEIKDSSFHRAIAYTFTDANKVLVNKLVIFDSPVKFDFSSNPYQIRVTFTVGEDVKADNDISRWNDYQAGESRGQWASLKKNGKSAGLIFISETRHKYHITLALYKW